MPFITPASRKSPCDAPSTTSIRALQPLRRVVADALIAAGRRIGALHMMSRIRRTVWPCDGNGADARSATMQNTTVLPDEISPGLLALGERLRDECTSSFDHFTSRWVASDAEAFLRDAERVATALAGR